MKKDYYTLLGLCFNACDFTAFANRLTKDCTYQSYDFLYILKGRARVLQMFENHAMQNAAAIAQEKVDIYTGFFAKQIFLLKTIKECCIITRQNSDENIRLLVFHKRRRKISQITGIDPKTAQIIRAKKI